MKPAAIVVCAGLVAWAQQQQSAPQPPQPPEWTKDAKVIPVAVGTTPNSTAFAGRVFFAAQPSAEDLGLYARLGVKTVINLRMPAEMEKAGIDENKLVTATGMTYLNVPFGPEPPTDADLDKIFPVLDKAGDAKVLLHCASSNRVGMVWAVYRGVRHGLPLEDAVGEGKAAGLKAPALEKAARGRLEAAAAGAGAAEKPAK